LPSDDDEFIGGHSVMAVGFDDIKEEFIIRNSWGINWGISGHFYMPYEYILDNKLSDDFWVIQIE
jgi:C1A family cysteine protease